MSDQFVRSTDLFRLNKNLQSQKPFADVIGHTWIRCTLTVSNSTVLKNKQKTTARKTVIKSCSNLTFSQAKTLHEYSELFSFEEHLPRTLGGNYLFGKCHQ